MELHVRGTGGPDPPPPMKNHKNTGFSSNTGPDPLKNRSCEARILYWAFIAGGPITRLGMSVTTQGGSGRQFVTGP